MSLTDFDNLHDARRRKPAVSKHAAGDLLKAMQIKQFRSHQWGVIRAVAVDRKDTLAVLPCGHGKSLIWEAVVTLFCMGGQPGGVFIGWGNES
jgi:superfamily II DNA helicase RecQ